MASDTIYINGNWRQAIRYTWKGTEDSEAIYRDGNLWQSVRYKEWEMKAGDTKLEMGIESKRYETQSWVLMSGVTIERDVYWRQAIRYTEMGTDGRLYGTQRWGLMTGDTIKENGTNGRRYEINWWELNAGFYDVLSCDMMAGVTIYWDWNWLQALQYKELGIYGRRYDIRDEFLWQTIRYTVLGTVKANRYREFVTNGRWYVIQRRELMARNTIYRNGNCLHAIR